MGAVTLNVPSAQWSVAGAYPAGPTVTRLHGAVDAEVADALQTCLVGGLERGADAVVDLTDVDLIDGTCQGVLVRAHCRARELGLVLVLAAPSPAVERTLAATGVDQTLRIRPDVGAAVTELRRHALEQGWPERLRRARKRRPPVSRWRRPRRAGL